MLSLTPCGYKMAAGDLIFLSYGEKEDSVPQPLKKCILIGQVRSGSPNIEDRVAGPVTLIGLPLTEHPRSAVRVRPTLATLCSQQRRYRVSTGKATTCYVLYILFQYCHF